MIRPKILKRSQENSSHERTLIDRDQEFLELDIPIAVMESTDDVPLAMLRAANRLVTPYRR